MKNNLALFTSIIVAVGLVALGFTFFQTFQERDRLINELGNRTTLVINEFYKSNHYQLNYNNLHNLYKLSDSICKQHHIIGIAIYFNKDSFVTLSPNIKPYMKYSKDYIVQAVNADTSIGKFFNIDHLNIYQYIKPIKNNGIADNAIVLYSDASYIEKIIQSIWLGNFLKWFIQALLMVTGSILLIRWGILSPINKIINWIKAARTGNIEQLNQLPDIGFLAPLHKEISNIAQAMQEARAMAEEEAKLRTSGEAIWTPDRLREEVKKTLSDKTLVVVSHREPYMHIHNGKEIKYIVPASGMVTAMEPILKACGGIWIAAGTGDADKETVDKDNKIWVPPDEKKYVLRRVWVSKEAEDHFYFGFSNEGIWPLCHIAHTRPVFREVDWNFYQKVNSIFAKAVLDEIKNENQPFILVQDYHFALLSEMIKKARPDAKVAIFWHIPWPNPESFGICPWQKEILHGMLGADLIGFHTQYHCNNFLETVNSSIESRVIWENFSVQVANHLTLVKPFPISISFTLKDYDNKENGVQTPAEILSPYGLKAQYFGIGVDRIDYTKGIIEKFLSIERFLEKNSEYQSKFTFIQIGAPSRTSLKNYADTIMAVENEAARINSKFKMKDWKPILLLVRHHSHEEIMPFYKSANLCMVTSLHDGMNLVAKEFVASRNSVDGVLILSRFAGASQELQGAITINPYDIEGMSNAIKISLEMPKEEQHQRMQQMRQVIVGPAAQLMHAWPLLH